MGLEGSLARLTDCTLAELRDIDPDGRHGRRGRSYNSEGQVRTGRRAWSPTFPAATPRRAS